MEGNGFVFPLLLPRARNRWIRCSRCLAAARLKDEAHWRSPTSEVSYTILIRGSGGGFVLLCGLVLSCSAGVFRAHCLSPFHLVPEFLASSMRTAVRVLRRSIRQLVDAGSSPATSRRSTIFWQSRRSIHSKHQRWNEHGNNAPRPRIATFERTRTTGALRGQESAGPLLEYERRVALGTLLPGDKHQEDALRALQALFNLLKSTAADGRFDKIEQSDGRSKSWWSQLLSGSSSRPSAQSSPRGLYLYGGVGTGKTMLMDMFYEQLPSTWRKKRLHFHDFMLNIHSLLQRFKGVNDPLEAVAEEFSKEALVLCIDEFMVTDVADALILNRLFRHLWEKGVVLVSTSNRPPDQLYEGGLQRDLFLPFIASLKERCVVHKIGSSTDYRKLNEEEKGFFLVGDGASELLKEKFRQVTNGAPAEATEVQVVMGRKLKVPLAANGCAYFQFYELCEMPLGAADYFGFFNHFHTLFLEGVPVFGSHNRVAAYRFVTLVDVMYEHRARFICSAEAQPEDLLKRIVTISDAPKRTGSRSAKNDEADLLVDNELGFAKDRTISRLSEMQTREYLDEHAAHLQEDDNNSDATGTEP